jgi:DNA-binding CsgD family transcriptional regulator
VIHGREDELRQVRDVVQAAREGTAQVLVIRGEAGIGKTAMLRYASSIADGFDLRQARAVESEHALSFALISMIVQPLMTHVRELPVVQQKALQVALGHDEAMSVDASLLGAAVLGLLTEAGRERPQLLLLDDLHWSDEISLQALMFALRRLSHDSVGALIALRDTDLPLVAGSGFTTVRPSPLDATSVAELIAQTVGHRPSPAAADRLALATGGNPLAIVELAQTLGQSVLSGQSPLRDPLPIGDGLVQAFAARARSLPDRTRRALLVVACSDERAGPVGDALPQLDLTMADLEPAEMARLVAVGGGRVAFVHPLMRTAVLADGVPADRRAAHRALARSGQVTPQARAWHCAEATDGPDVVAARLLATVAETVAIQGDHSAAADLFDRASQLTPDVDESAVLRLDAAGAMRLAGRHDALRRLVDDGLRQPGDNRTRGRWLALKAEVDDDPAVRHHTGLEAATLLAPHDVTAAARALAQAMYAAIASRSADLVHEAARRALALDISADRRAQFERDSVVGVALATTGNLVDALPFLTKVVAAVEREPDLRADPGACEQAIVASDFFGLTVQAGELADSANAIARRQGRLSIVPALHHRAGRLAFHRSQWIRAMAHYAEAADLYGAMGDEDGVTAARAYLAEIQAHRGEFDAAFESANRRMAWADARGITRDRPPAVRVIAMGEMRNGQAELALRRLAGEARETLDGVGVRLGPLTVIEDLVDAALLTATADAALEGVERLSAYARVSPDPLASALAARGRAQLAEGAEAEKEYRSALTFHEQDVDAFAAARTRLRFGEWLRRKGRRADAREQLYACLSVFDRLQAEPWIVRAREELRSTGETVGSRADVAVRLTPQEIRVGMAVAEGVTNREVASQLFMSVKTVEYHLGSIFRKLGLTSRAQLARHRLFIDPAQQAGQ